MPAKTRHMETGRNKPTKISVRQVFCQRVAFGADGLRHWVMRNIRAFMVVMMIGTVAMTAIASDTLKVKFRSRALLDATASGYGKDEVQGYYRLEDFRVGFKANYGKFELKADIGLGGGKVAVKDLLLNYHFNNSVISVGNGYEPFSMDMLISTADLRFHQSAASVLAFTNSRKLGVTYHYHDDNWYLATGVYTNNDINKLGDEKKKSLVSTSRVVWRTQDQLRKRLLHVGGAFSFRTKDVNKENPVGTMSSDGVTSMFPSPLLEAEIDNMGTELKGVLEVLYTSRKVLLQAESFVDRLNRSGGLRHYLAHGGYAQGSYLIVGEGFDYDEMYAIPGRPLSDKAVELVARFNYTNLNDGKSGIYGGEEKYLSLGVNWYLNKYLGVKFNGSYVWVGDHCDSFYDKNFFLFQARIQYIF